MKEEKCITTKKNNEIPKIIEYVTLEETLYSEELSETYRTYGVAVLENGQQIFAMHDVSLDRTAVDTLVRKCNKYSLEPVHLPDVVDDFLAEC